MKNVTEATLWKNFSKFIRLRDSDERGNCRCISCSSYGGLQAFQAGHYYSKGSDVALKYNEVNVSAQCVSCNYHKSGNLLEYRQGLIRKYGEEVVNKLDIAHNIKTTRKKLNQLEINALNNDYKKRIKELEDSKFS